MVSVPTFERPQESIARHLRQAILDGTYTPGERLPVERELSEQFGVSRSAIRQALLILSQQGLVKVRSGSGGGPFVTSGSLPAAVAAFENVLVSDPVAVEEFVQAKLVIEPSVNAHAAASITPEYVQLLRENVAASRRALRSNEDGTELALAFHAIIFQSIGNRYMSVILEVIGQTLERLPDAPGASPIDSRQIVRDHEQLIEALEQHDIEKVRQLSVDHLQHIWHRNGATPTARPAAQRTRAARGEPPKRR